MKQTQSSINIPGLAGNIEAVLHKPLVETRVNTIGILCHPHPQYAGTMNNKVVTSMAKVFNNMGLTAIRFNFRGVGNSEGEFDNTVGETEDCLSVIRWVKQNWPESNLWLAGFSFGSFVAAKAASTVKVDNLISIAPPVHHNDFTNLVIDCPWLVIQGDLDEVVPPDEVYAWYNGLVANKSIISMPEASHFFHGQLIELQKKIQEHFEMP